MPDLYWHRTTTLDSKILRAAHYFRRYWRPSHIFEPTNRTYFIPRSWLFLVVPHCCWLLSDAWQSGGGRVLLHIYIILNFNINVSTLFVVHDTPLCWWDWYLCYCCYYFQLCFALPELNRPDATNHTNTYNVFWRFYLLHKLWAFYYYYNNLYQRVVCVCGSNADQ